MGVACFGAAIHTSRVVRDVSDSRWAAVRMRRVNKGEEGIMSVFGGLSL